MNYQKIKITIGGLIILILGRLLYLYIKNRQQRVVSLKSFDFDYKTDFTMKAITTVIGFPDEIAHALVDEKKRHLWDINCTGITRKPIKGDHFEVQYTTLEGKIVTERLTYTFAEAFINGSTTYLIHESVNDGQENRYYEI